MAVKTTDAVKAEAKTEAKLEVKKQRYVELVTFKRYVWNGALYEAGVAYPVTDAQSDMFLTHRCESVSPFRLYQEPEAEKDKFVRGTRGIGVPVAPLPTTVSAEVKDSTQIPKKIEIGDDSEIAEFLPGADDLVEA